MGKRICDPTDRSDADLIFSERRTRAYRVLSHSARMSPESVGAAKAAQRYPACQGPRTWAKASKPPTASLADAGGRPGRLRSWVWPIQVSQPGCPTLLRGKGSEDRDALVTVTVTVTDVCADP